MSNQTLNLTPKVYDYLLKVSLRESEVLEQLRTKTQDLSDSMMQISPEQGQFMALLVKLTQAEHILEIGTYTGYSALAMAAALPEHGRVQCLEINEESIEIANQFWQMAQVSKKIQVHIQPAIATLEAFINQGKQDTFDLAFIDADKPNYPNYFERALTLVKPGGLILVDNTLWSGQVADKTINDADTQAIRAFNETLLEDKRVDLSLLPISDGLTLALKRSSSQKIDKTVR